MAKLVLNPGLRGIHGAIGGFVYRSVRGHDIVGARPERIDHPSAAQLEVRARMKEAAAYAKAVAHDEARRGVYVAAAKTRAIPLVAIMVSDFLKPPVVDAIDLAGYHGAVGDPIKVAATDYVAVQSVNVEVRAPNGTVLEQGAATPDGGQWVYQGTMARTPGQVVTITATATDLPGHTGEKTETWS